MPKDIDHIRIRGARVNNLKNISLDLPLKKLICFAGPSGSGKTSLAFHTLMTESKRRFVNSFPNSMKFFTDRPAAVDVDEIYPVLPVFALSQINPVMGARSVVGDTMRVTEVMQGLFAHHAIEYCPKHDEPVIQVSFAQQLRFSLKGEKDEGQIYYLLMDSELAAAVLGNNFLPSRSWNTGNKSVSDFNVSDDHWVIIRFKIDHLDKLDSQWSEIIPKLIGRPLKIWREGQRKPREFVYASQLRCPVCDFQGRGKLSPNAFTPHSAFGACKICRGYGANLEFDPERMINPELSVYEDGVAFLKFGPLSWWKDELIKTMKRKKWSAKVAISELPKEFHEVLWNGEKSWPGFQEVIQYLESKRYKPAVRVFMRKMQKEILCQNCHGSRIDEQISNHKLSFEGQRYSLLEMSKLTISQLAELFDKPLKNVSAEGNKLQADLVLRFKTAISMGLGHLEISRKAKSLSGGEYQRLLLLKYLSYQGTDGLFILDEPSLGLAQAELKMLINGLRHLIEQGNTVVVIDHSEFIHQSCDHLVLMGPESGHRGGEILYQGKPKQNISTPLLKNNKPVLGRDRELLVKGASIYGKCWPDFTIPLERMTWVSGESGGGKTACLINIFAQYFYKKIYQENLVDLPGHFKTIKGKADFSDVIIIDANLNRFTSRSSVGSLTDLAPAVRKHFLKLPVARALGLKDGHFSANSDLGACSRCEGRGVLTIEMQYLEDIVLTCEDCKGKRLRPIYADISDGEMTVAQAYNLPLHQVLERIDLTPKYRRIWDYLKLLNLDYLSLERPVNSLSGGEKQRLYLLSKLLHEVKNSLLVFENISFGLSQSELVRLAQLLQDLAQLGNTLLVIDADPIFAQLCHAHVHFSSDKINTIYLS